MTVPTSPPISLFRSFPPALEAAYQADLAGEKVHVFDVATALSSVLYICFAFLDSMTLPSNTHAAWCVRACVVALTLGACLFAHVRRKAFLRHYSVVVCGVVLSWAAGVEAIMLLSQPSDPAWGTYHVGIILVMMGLYNLTYLTPLVAGIAGQGITISYILLALLYQRMGQNGQWVTLVQNCFFLVGAFLGCLFAMGVRDRFGRQAFLLKNALTHDLRLEEEAKRQSEHLAEHDALTGLSNRVRFMRRLGEMLATRNEAETVTVLFLDLDDFKPVNDRYGHAAGDRVLATIAERLRGTIRSGDLAARLGGDEFVIALPLAQGQGELIAARMGAALYAAISQPIEFDGHVVRVTASIGAASCAGAHCTAEGLMHRADLNMYDAKRNAKLVA